MKTIKNLTADELRKSILQLAIQGKLVKQNPNDEPASELVKKIYDEKKKLIAEGKIRKDKNKSYIFKGDDNCYYEKIGKNEPVKLENLPFNIPNNWTWIKLKSLANIYNGNSINEDEKKKKYTNVKGRDFIATKDVGFDRTITYNNGINIPYALNTFKIAPANKILMCIEGGSAGRKIAITDREVCFGNKLACFDSIIVNDEYLFNIFQSNGFTSIFKSSLTGIIGGVSINTLKDFIMPLPPFEEQQRIVNKINSFEPLLQEYEKYEKKLTELESSFAEKLKKSILQYAIEGKLVKQDPNDEPASVLLERIKAEKEKLIKEGKIKRDKNESYIYQGDDKNYYEKIGKNEPVKLEDLPFDIPDNWTWIRFPNLVNFILGKTPERYNPKYWNKGKYPWFSIADMKDKSIVYETKEKISEDSLKENFNYSLSPIGTLLMSFKLTVGRVSILGVDAVHNEAIISIFPYLNNNNDIRDWLFYTLGILVNFVNQTYAIKGNTLNKEKMSSMLIPLPPIEEEDRIVKKITSINNYL